MIPVVLDQPPRVLRGQGHEAGGDLAGRFMSALGAGPEGYVEPNPMHILSEALHRKLPVTPIEPFPTIEMNLRHQ
jgi:hypothetical protein